MLQLSRHRGLWSYRYIRKNSSFFQISYPNFSPKEVLSFFCETLCLFCFWLILGSQIPFSQTVTFSVYVQAQSTAQLSYSWSLVRGLEPGLGSLLLRGEYVLSLLSVFGYCLIPLSSIFPKRGGLPVHSSPASF